MSRILKWLFTPYVKNDFAAGLVYHRGVGYDGVNYAIIHASEAKVYHYGMGYGGLN